MKKFICIMLAMLVVAITPISAFAQTYDLADGSITVSTNEESGLQYVSQIGGAINELQNSVTIIIQSNSGTATSNTITINGGGNAEVTFQNINGSTVKVEDSTDATINLSGDNKVTGANNNSGVTVLDGSSVVINGGENDSLSATGSTVEGSGIGGNSDEGVGDITINGGNITATGGMFGQGIEGDSITINGGTVNANATFVADGLRGNTVTINGGEVTATGHNNGAGISADEVKITDGTVVANGGSGGSGIGSGSNYVNVTTPPEFSVTIEGGNVTANGGPSGAGIGTGSGSYGVDITISGGTVVANGGSYAAGIGSGRNGDECNITISGGTVTATGGNTGTNATRGPGEGIGSGFGANESTVTITGGTVNATAGQITNEYSGVPAENISVNAIITGGIVNGTNHNPTDSDSDVSDSDVSDSDVSDSDVSDSETSVPGASVPGTSAPTYIHGASNSKYVPIVSENATVVKPEKAAEDWIVVVDDENVEVEVVIDQDAVVLAAFPQSVVDLIKDVVTIAMDKVSDEATKLVILPESLKNVKNLVITYTCGEASFNAEILEAEFDAETLEAAIDEALDNGMVFCFIINEDGTLELTLEPIALYYEIEIK